jgi:LPXTG-motif cell wall-anchored protein
MEPPVRGAAGTSAARRPRLISGAMEWYQWLMIVLLIALIAFWFFMRKKGAQ